MIAVRLVKRTHYQVLEPAYLSRLVCGCTSPTSSNFRDNVAKKFLETTKDINIAASKYVVDLARSLQLVNSNLVWTELGHLLNVVTSGKVLGTTLELSAPEKILYLRLFLEFDGAALIFLARKLEAQRQLPDSGETWADVAQELFLTIYEQYLDFVTDPQLRTRVRQLAEKRRHTPFKGSSGRHQSLVHIHTLYRTGMVDASRSGSGRIYLVKQLDEGNRLATSELLSAIPDVKALEQIILSRNLYEVVGRVLGIQRKSRLMSDTEFMDQVRTVYTQVMDTGVNLCSLQTISEALQIQSLIKGTELESHTTILSRLRAMQNKMPSQIRFHVDQYGHPAYLKMGPAS